MEINPGSGLAVCKLKILHVGRNLPGVKDPSAGLVTTQNSSDMGYDARLSDGYGAWIGFDMVTNWGEGAFSNDLTTDADTVQIGAFLSHFTERSTNDETYDVNHKATMAKSDLAYGEISGNTRLHVMAARNTNLRGTPSPFVITISHADKTDRLAYF